ncbi:MAG: collagenase [Chloroflexi bacterium]|nr:collagenase [Chloroflexota bacterium]
MRLKTTIFFLLLGLIAAPLQSAFAAPPADVTNDKVTFSFPETATFSATLTANASITAVVLEYGNEQQTCGEVIAKAFPQFAPGKNVDVEWIWDMRQSGSLPPGSSLWWRWRYTDETGKEYLSDTKTATWLDDDHKWQTISSEFLRLHWYDGSKAFAQDLLNAGELGLSRNAKQAGLAPEAPIDIYIYSSYQDLQDSILYEPSWTGGSAYAEHNIVIVGLAQDNAEYDRSVVIHELTHVLIGHFTFSCLNDLPSWLVEGLAVYSEGELDSNSQVQFDQAIQDNELISVRALSSGFSEEYGKATLSYSESFSLVKFLIETHGQDKMTQLLGTLRDGSAIEPALLDTYGFDLDGLEDGWRQAVGAAPRAVSAQPTAQPTPTFVPTIVPVSGAPIAVTPTPYAIPTSTINDNGSTPGLAGPPIWLTVSLLCFCCMLMLIIGVFVLGFVVRSQNHKARKNDQA